MRTSVNWLCLIGLILLAGCATPTKTVIPDTSAVPVTATAEQLLIGKHRGASIHDRWSEEKRTGFLKSGSSQLAVKTLGLTPEQVVSLGGKIPSPETSLCVVIWDVKTQKVLSTECYVVATPPALGVPARFGPHTAVYVGSF